jgi:anti-anti-sigma factor
MERGGASRYRQEDTSRDGRMHMPPVSVTTRTDGVLQVLLRGEIDYTNAAPVTDAVRQAVERDRPAAVHVDLHEVTFLDSSGIGVLISAMKAAGAIGAGYRVLAPNPKVLSQLEITGLTELFQVDPQHPSAAGG